MEDKGKFLRTVVKNDVYDRLENFSKQFETGRGHWDIGVAIQILLDFYEYHHSTTDIHGKLDMLLNGLMQPPKQEVEEETGTDMLGGERLK